MAKDTIEINKSEGGRYYSQPQARYSPQQPQDPRSHQGLAGGVVGSVLGYEIGNGNPVAAGLGSAVGSYLGNGVAGGR
jgi:outer membrane lipoprotein SlyB